LWCAEEEREGVTCGAPCEGSGGSADVAAVGKEDRGSKAGAIIDCHGIEMPFKIEFHEFEGNCWGRVG